MYKINYSNLKRDKKYRKIYIVSCIIILLIEFYFYIEQPKNLTRYHSAYEYLTRLAEQALVLILPAYVLIKDTIELLKLKKYENIIKDLSYNGTLIKNLPYERIKQPRLPYHRKRIEFYERIKVNYKYMDGKNLELISERKYNTFNINPDVSFNVHPETADLLIDLNDPSKFFIDYNITEY